MSPTPPAASTRPLPPEAELRLARPEDAEGIATCYVESLAETYAHIMPPEFAQKRRDGLADEVASTRSDLERMAADLAAGVEPNRTQWVALLPDEQGTPEVVGIASAGPGVPDWERLFYTNPEPPVGWNLDHLYTRRRSHGTGIGQALFDLALTDPATGRPRGCWLWILRENPRAEAFYRRNGLVEEGLEVECGGSWFHRPMFRMWRPDPTD